MGYSFFMGKFSPQKPIVPAPSNQQFSQQLVETKYQPKPVPKSPEKIILKSEEVQDLPQITIP